jgi:hypothetical protein
VIERKETQITMSTETHESITIRRATNADGAGLTRLAQLDSVAPPAPDGILVAEVDGEILAALPLDGRPAFADPFRHTSALLELLDTRAAELVAPVASVRRRGLLTSLRSRARPRLV